MYRYPGAARQDRAQSANSGPRTPGLANDASRTIVAPYSLRAAELPTVSAPVTWDELEAALRKRAPECLTFTAADVPARLEAVGDPLAPALELRQRLPAV